MDRTDPILQDPSSQGQGSNKAQLLNERLSVYRQILNTPIKYYPVNEKENFKNQINK